MGQSESQAENASESPAGNESSNPMSPEQDLTTPILQKGSDLEFPAPVLDRGSDPDAYQDDSSEGNSDDLEVGGGKTIGLFGSISLLVNNMLGSGIAVFPAAFQNFGWFLAIFTLVLSGLLTVISSWMVVFAIRSIPGNAHFQRRIEYTTVCRFYLTTFQYQTCQVMFQLSLLVMNMSNIIQTAQAVDFVFVHVYGESCALQLAPGFGSIVCPKPEPQEDSVFDPESIVIASGLVVVALISIPLGLWNLDDNIIVQNIAMVLILTTVGLWCGGFCFDFTPDFDHVPFGPMSLHGIVGLTLFNFAFNVTVPSWLNEKKETTPVMTALMTSIVLSVLMYVFIGLLGGIALPLLGSDETLLSKLAQSSNASLRWSTILYPVAANLTSIPVFVICMRYNLLESRLCGPIAANIISGVIPWVLSVPFYNGSGFNTLVNVGGCSVMAVMNFVLPPYLFMQARKRIAETRERFVSDGRDESPIGDNGSPTTPLNQRDNTKSRLLQRNISAETVKDNEDEMVGVRQRRSIARVMFGQRKLTYDDDGSLLVFGWLGDKSAMTMLGIMIFAVGWGLLDSMNLDCPLVGCN